MKKIALVAVLTVLFGCASVGDARTVDIGIEELKLLCNAPNLVGTNISAIMTRSPNASLAAGTVTCNMPSNTPLNDWNTVSVQTASDGAGLPRPDALVLIDGAASKTYTLPEAVSIAKAQAAGVGMRRVVLLANHRLKTQDVTVGYLYNK